MSKFMNFKHKVAEAIDNLGKNTIIVATAENGAIRFEEMRTESSKKVVLEAIKHCPNQFLVAFNGRLVKDNKSTESEKVVENKEDYPSDVTPVRAVKVWEDEDELTDEDIAEMEGCCEHNEESVEDCAYSPDYHCNKDDCVEREVKDDTN